MKFIQEVRVQDHEAPSCLSLKIGNKITDAYKNLENLSEIEHHPFYDSPKFEDFRPRTLGAVTQIRRPPSTRHHPKLAFK
jgi:hypothetical protein